MDNEQEYEQRMQKALDAFSKELSSLRVGRASQTLLEPVMVESYGNKVGINHVASISVIDTKTLSVNVWDQNIAGAVEKAIGESNLGLDPQREGCVIKIRLPDLTEERRKELLKVAGKYAETARIAIRNIRRDGIDHLRKAEKISEISEDELRKSSDSIQKLTDRFIAKLDEALALKEKDMMQV